MGRSLAQIFKDADAIIEKTASASTTEPAPVTVETDDDIFKLAEEIRCSGRVKEAKVKELTHTEKIAYAHAFIGTLMDAERLGKLREFEKQAKENGLAVQAEDLVKKATAVNTVEALVNKVLQSKSGN